MLQPLRQPTGTSAVWCGRSWEALAERRAATFAQALTLRATAPSDCRAVVSDFLEFFDAIGVGLFRDEEEWVFRAMRPAPAPVVRALEEHIAITSLIGALVVAAEARCVDLRVVHHLGELLENHLVLEEVDVRPLIGSRPAATNTLNEGAAMGTTRITSFMKRSLETRLSGLNARIDSLQSQQGAADETSALLAELTRERDDVVEALRDARLIDDDPFDTDAIEVGDVVTIRDAEGETERYVLVDGNAGSRARSDWVSVASPLGAAILGRNTGDRVRVESPRGVTECEILAFERASDDRAAVSEPAPAPLRLPSEAFLG